MEENQRKTKKFRDLLKLSWLEIIILAVFVLLLFLLFQLINQGNSCIKNPFVYGAREVTEEDNDLYCRCSFTDGAYSSFTFNKEGITHEVEIQGIPGKHIPDFFFGDSDIE